MLLKSFSHIYIQVPVLASIDGKTAIPDSLDITKFLSKSYPGLIPLSKYEEVLDMLKRLHTINFFSLTFAGKPEIQEKAKARLQQILNSDINQRYREALESKVRRYVHRSSDPYC
jgi:glutathione S-transferase